MGKRLLIAIPMFILGFGISKAEFRVIWRFFGWASRPRPSSCLMSRRRHTHKEGKLHWSLHHFPPSS